MIPATFQLFGPVQYDGAHKSVNGAVWVFPGNALSASTKTFIFSRRLPFVTFARWLLVWTPNASADARLVYFDDGPTNIVQVAELHGASSTPQATAVDITHTWNNLAQAGVTKTFGFQLKDDGIAPVIYESRLEFTFTE